MAQELVDSGVLKPEVAPQTRFAHVLSSSIGGQVTNPVVFKDTMLPVDVTLLCSDGLTKHVTDAQIANRLANLESSEQACRTLVDDALAGGGSDNVTVLVLRAIVPGTK